MSPQSLDRVAEIGVVNLRSGAWRVVILMNRLLINMRVAEQSNLSGTLRQSKMNF